MLFCAGSARHATQLVKCKWEERTELEKYSLLRLTMISDVSCLALRVSPPDNVSHLITSHVSPFTSHASLGVDRFCGNRQIFDRNPLENVQHRDHMLVFHAGIAAEHER
jgi:hypothetical protein